MQDRYIVNLYSGNVYCGNGFFNTFDECVDFLNKDGFSDKAVIVDTKNDDKYTVKVKRKESFEFCRYIKDHRY